MVRRPFGGGGLVWFLTAVSAFAFDPADLDTLQTSNRCQRCDLLGVDLSNSTLHHADLRGAQLQSSNRADLGHANLGRANLSEATLAGTDFPSADLTGAGLWLLIAAVAGIFQGGDFLGQFLECSEIILLKGCLQRCAGFGKLVVVVVAKAGK